MERRMREKEREGEICTEEVAGRARVETRKKDVGRRPRRRAGSSVQFFFHSSAFCSKNKIL